MPVIRNQILGMCKKRIINWVDEILDVVAIMAGITVDIMLASGTEIRFPVDVLEIIRKTGMINDEGKLIVSRGVVEIGPDDNDLVKIIVGKKFAYEFGSKRG